MNLESIVTKSLNVFKIAISLPIAVAVFGIASFWHNVSLDPKTVTIGKTPVLLIHGSDSNQQQWTYFRQFLSGKDIGHVFAVNLNKKARKNDHDRDILDYARAIQSKLSKMKELYKEAGWDLNEVIFVGNSMGGLVAAAYYITEEIEEKDKFAIKALISISSPWKGSKIADVLCDRNKYPEKYFCRCSVDRDNLITKFVELAKRNELPVYNYGSTMDLLVPAESAKLPIPIDNVLINDKNDHWTTMVDHNLAFFIRDNWVQKHTNILFSIIKT